MMVNRNYKKNKAKREKEIRVREMYQQGKSIYEILEKEKISEYEYRKILGLE